MADIRIKDLTTTASSTASDDFIAVDGTTNGTRKLSAFSPTFGGNATVTGTLTGNSTITGANLISSVNSGAANGSEFTAFSALVGTDASLGPCRINIGALPSATFGSRYGYIACYDSGDYRKLYLGGSPGIAATGGQILIPATIASTTTSTGALVVGNGTSGGLGVGGAANIGGALSMYGEDFTIHNVGYGSWVLRNTAGSAVFDIRNGAGSWLTFPNLAGTVEFKTLATTVKVAATTASTTTSTGALVVSGGMGIAKQIVAGEDITIDPIDASPENLAPEVAFCRSASLATATSVLAFGSSSRIGLLRGYHDGADQVEWRFGSYIGTTFNEQMRLGGTSATSSSLTLYGTTASTSTSSGALVVSGGVGVAGAIYAGGNITIDKAAPDFTLVRSANTNSGLIQLTTSTTYDFAIGLRNTTDSDLHIYNYGTSNDALKIARSDSLATFGGAVRTAAPSGGTAANWKLGTVATVSPTSPNRTIEVDIGGTIYYIHAKTTNN